MEGYTEFLKQHLINGWMEKTNRAEVADMVKEREKKSVAFFERNSWYHRIKTLNEDGTIKYGKKGGFANQKEAEESYHRCEEEFNTSLRKQQLSNKDNKEVMFKDYLIYWFEEVFSKRIETTTRMVGAYVVYGLIVPNIDYDIKMRFVSVEYLDGLLERASKSCASAGNKSREILNLAMKEAVIEGYVNVNPVPETKPYKRKKPNIVILSKDKIKVLLQAASKDNWYLEILLGLFCGLRKGEIYGLKFSDFDIEQKTVKISRQIVANPIIKDGRKIENYNLQERDPKTPNSFRVLRIPDVVIRELENRRNMVNMYKEKMGDEFIDNDYISCQSNGKVHSLSSMNIALRKLCIRNSLPVISVHALRHMFATILVERGVSLAKISGLLGHSSVNTTFEYYCDVMDEKEKIIAFMNDTFTP